MRRILVVLAFAAVGTGCASFNTLTPGSNSDKGVWVAKTTQFFGLQMSDQEVLFCSSNSGAPSCVKAGGDVKASKVSN